MGRTIDCQYIESYIREVDQYNLRPLFIKRQDVLPHDPVKSRSHEIWFQTFPNPLKFEWQISERYDHYNTQSRGRFGGKTSYRLINRDPVHVPSYCG